MAGFGRKVTQRHWIEKRRAARSQTIAPAIVETPASHEPVTIIDISASGAQIFGSKPAPTRPDVQIKVNGLALFGTIAWRKNNSFGIKFDQLLNELEPSEIHCAIQEAKFELSAFDREAALQELVNKPPKAN